MKSLRETNPYLKDPAVVEEMLRHSVRESSYFEGARRKPKPGSRAKRLRRKASAKTKAKGS
jgi:hypothetical protein